MNICLIALEYFNWRKYGGIGKATRDIATGLAQRGHKISVIVPLGRGQQRYEKIDTVNIYGFPLIEYPFIGELLRRIDADIYHSQDPTIGTWLAKSACSNRVHLLTCQNPKTSDDWGKVIRFYPMRRRLYNSLIEPRVTACVKELNHVYCQTKYTIKKARQIFNLEYDPTFLPNPVEVPDNLPSKSVDPTVLFLGRFDGEKNPERYMQLAEKFPDVTFIAAGASHNQEYDGFLRVKYGGLNNLILPGFVDGVDKNRLLDDSWILVNTSVSECLPVSYLEATAHGCAILSPHDPDGFASCFGKHIPVDRLDEGLSWLLEDERWRERGLKGFNYVREHHEMKKVIDQHIAEYKEKMG